ncbi:hypothetical protein C2845_PM10G20180 [Panicum miliaceum]|uniref:RRM domain-containing protein n=1 Tax=Panicum miliaceum TaxID=4540 RepID=A0A3L6PDU4_PANMI|nr:hypothetical protein C2845_PM10G20180 [Panicum miliaceum]
MLGPCQHASLRPGSNRNGKELLSIPGDRLGRRAPSPPPIRVGGAGAPHNQASESPRVAQPTQINASGRAPNPGSCSSVVFVGNIPYHAGEEELRAACEEIGPVVSLRVATDEGTAKPRGFAFVEYLDDETALSACRNLHGRALRVGLERQRGAATRDDDAGADEEHRPVGAEGAAHAASMLAPSARPSGAVTAYLPGLSRRQLRELLGALGREDPGLVERANTPGWRR